MSMSYKTDKEMNTKHLKILNGLLQRPENKECADCNSKGPRWASTNLGVFICIRCAGIHRNLGTHISKVRSTTLDSWTPEQIQIICKMGNEKAHSIYEAKLPSNKKKPDENEDSRVVEQWIRAKYERKVYTDEDALRSFQQNPDGGSSSGNVEKKKKKKPKKKESDDEEDDGVSEPSSTGSSPLQPISPANPTPPIKSTYSSQPTSSAPKQKPISISQPSTPTVPSSNQASVSLIDFGDATSTNQQQLMQFVAPSTTTTNTTAPSAKTPMEQHQQFAPPQKDSSQVKDSILSLFSTPTPQHPTNNYYNPQQAYYAQQQQQAQQQAYMRTGMMQQPMQQPMYSQNAYVMPGAMYGHQQPMYPQNIYQNQQQGLAYQNNMARPNQMTPNPQQQNVQPNPYYGVPQRPTSAPPANWGNGYNK